MNDRFAALEAQVAGLLAAMAERDVLLAERDARIAELENLLDESRRGGKRQAAPFSKGDPTNEPKQPGRKTGKAHGRHGHRPNPPDAHRTLDADLPAACPCCGGEIEATGEGRPVPDRPRDTCPGGDQVPGPDRQVPWLRSTGAGPPP